MNAEMDGLWLAAAVVTGAVGAGMLLYGIRQKEPLPLVFGLAFSVVPMLVSTGWAAVGVSVAVGGLFVVVRKYF